MPTPADEYARQVDLEPLAALDGFFDLMDAGRLFETAAPDTLQIIRQRVYLALTALLVAQRPSLEAERGLAWPYDALDCRVALLEACARQSKHPRLQQEAVLFLALLPFPRQWRWLSQALCDWRSHPEIANFLDLERQNIQAKLAAKPLSRYKLRHFCQVLKKPCLPDEKGVLRIFALPYALLDPGLLKALSHQYVLYIEPAAGVIFRHHWYRAFSALRDPCLLGLAGAEDRRFLAGQPGIETTDLAHGDFLEPDGTPPVRPPIYDLVFIATYNEIPRKRHLFLLELLGHPRLRGLTALCVGRGSQDNVKRFQNVVCRQGLGDRVAVLANLPRAKIPELLAQCRIGIHLALHENACRCIYEFFRADLPCIISASTGASTSTCSPRRPAGPHRTASFRPPSPRRLTSADGSRPAAGFWPIPGPSIPPASSTPAFRTSSTVGAMPGARTSLPWAAAASTATFPRSTMNGFARSFRISSIFSGGSPISPCSWKPTEPLAGGINPALLGEAAPVGSRFIPARLGEAVPAGRGLSPPGWVRPYP